MHHSVRKSYLIDKVSCTVYGLLLRVIDVIERMKYIFNDPVIAIQCKGSLEHDCGTPHHPAFQLLIFFIPEIYIECR